MNKRERILTMTTAIFVILSVVLAITMFMQKPRGNVDIGYGYEVSRAEFDEYSAMAEQTTKEILLELEVIKDAAKELGVTVTDDQIQQEVDSVNLVYNYKKGTGEYCDLKLHTAVSLIETKCLEHYRDKINPTEEEIASALEDVSEKIMVDCEYKSVSEVEGIIAQREGVKFEDVESKYTVLDAGTETAISVVPQDGMEVGGTYIQENGEDYAIFKITKIYSTDNEKREGIVYKLKEQKAENEFYDYVSEFYQNKLNGTTEDDKKTSATKKNESSETAGKEE